MKIIILNLIICLLIVAGIPFSIYYYLNKILNVGSLKRYLKEVFLNERH